MSMASCGSVDKDVVQHQIITEELEGNTPIPVIQDTETELETESETEMMERFGSRTNVLQVGDSIKLTYWDFYTESIGEFEITILSNQDGKTKAKLRLESDTKNKPFTIEQDSDSLIYNSTVQFIQVDDPMKFVWGDEDFSDHVLAEEKTVIGVSEEQEFIWNTRKQYLVIITQVLKEEDEDLSFDLTSEKCNYYYTFIKLY